MFVAVTAAATATAAGLALCRVWAVDGMGADVLAREGIVDLMTHPTWLKACISNLELFVAILGNRRSSE